MVIHNGMSLVIAEGEKRGFTITVHNEEEELLRAERNGEGFVFRNLPGYMTTYQYVDAKYEGGKQWFVSKPGCEQVLAEQEIPVPQAYGVHTPGQAFDDSTWQYPVVAKPVLGAQSRNVYTGLQNIAAVQESAEIIWETGEDVLVERHVNGLNYRLMMFRDQYVGTCWRRSPQVTGDGKHTIAELIDIRNQGPEKGPIDDAAYTSHPIVPDTVTDRLLTEAGYTMETILPANEVCVLHTKINGAVGTDYVDVTDQVHESYITAARRFMRAHDLYTVGFDIITPDITAPMKEVNAVFNEHNIFPGVGLVENCNVGTPQPVSKYIWDYIEVSGVVSDKFELF